MRPSYCISFYFVFIALVVGCCIAVLWFVRESGLVELFHVAAAVVFMAGALAIYHAMEWFARLPEFNSERVRE